MGDLCAVVLAAGEGQRLRPLTDTVPKALCPVGNVPLLDLALARIAGFGLGGPADVAVNASYLGDQVVAHTGDRAHLSVEPDRPLGTSGGVGNLRDWIGGRGVLVGNADAYLAGGDPGALLDGWDGETVRLLGQPERDKKPGLFSGHRFVGFSLLPWRRVRDLDTTPAELVRTVWRPAEADGELEVVPFDGVFFDTGTPRDYLAANLHAAGGANLIAGTVTGRCTRSVVGPGAVVAGDVTDSVVWPNAEVVAGERLDHVIRAGRQLTVAGR
ncbi:sugar phosphate nucleotidyltransferase [Asanoa sp. NPDC049518]|uniref:nucleotidyltransferase family protein n=1 Tax=unclassified Asanoa TaxID=2685164 RepID=UPI00342B2217